MSSSPTLNGEPSSEGRRRVDNGISGLGRQQGEIIDCTDKRFDEPVYQYDDDISIGKKEDFESAEALAELSSSEGKKRKRSMSREDSLFVDLGRRIKTSPFSYPLPSPVSSRKPSTPSSSKLTRRSTSTPTPNAQHRLQRAKRMTEVLVFIEKYVDLIQMPGIAIVSPTGVHQHLITCTDLNSDEARKHTSLLHSVNCRLRSPKYNNVDDVQWPFGFRIMKNIPELRRINHQGSRRQVYEGIRCCHSCRMQNGHSFAGPLQVKCMSDPIERDGCSVCKARKGAPRFCTQRMEVGNDIFVSWSLEDVGTERKAWRRWSTAVDSAIALAKQLKALLSTQPDTASGDARLANRIKDIMLSDDGLRARRKLWKDARKEIGAENMTRIGDDETRRYIRKLDEGEKLVWSMRQIVDTEQRAYQRYDSADDLAQDRLNDLKSYLDSPNTDLTSPINIVLQQIYDAFGIPGGINNRWKQLVDARTELGQE